jgi:hypothetical protein
MHLPLLPDKALAGSASPIQTRNPIVIQRISVLVCFCRIQVLSEQGNTGEYQEAKTVGFCPAGALKKK